MSFFFNHWSSEFHFEKCWWGAFVIHYAGPMSVLHPGDSFIQSFTDKNSSPLFFSPLFLGILVGWDIGPAVASIESFTLSPYFQFSFLLFYFLDFFNFISSFIYLYKLPYFNLRSLLFYSFS